MADDNQRNAAPNKPQNQTGEEYGSVKGAQVTPHDMRGRSDTARGSEPETRSASGNRG